MRSMTGSGQGTTLREGVEVTVDLRSVNHRYLDVAFRLSRACAFLEEPLRKAIGAKVRRGHLEVNIQIARVSGESPLTVQLPLARSLHQAAVQLSEELQLPNNVTVAQLLQMDGVVQAGNEDDDRALVTETALQAISQALDRLIAAREAEGALLQADLRALLAQVEELRRGIAALAPTVVEAYRDRLIARLAAWQVEVVEPQRIAQEVAILADRCAIDEELSRLHAHVAQMTQFLDTTGEIGKKMDFLTQEMNREANTIGSKSPDSAIAQQTVALKSVIEKIREQVQNVE